MAVQVGPVVVCAVVLFWNPWGAGPDSAKPAARPPAPAPRITGVSGHHARVLGTVEIPRDCHRQNGDARFSHRCGVALLLAGDPRTAVQVLTRATELAPETPAYWSDLAVALQALARQRDEAHFLPDALAAADRALRVDDDYVPALFNRASTLASMGIVASATRGYELCQRLVPHTAWGREATRRLQDLLREKPEYSAASLKEALASSDDTLLDEVCGAFGSEVVAYVEDVLLVQWGNHILAGEAARAEAVLRAAQRLSRSLHRASAETSVMANLVAIDRADERQRIALATGYRLFGAARRAYAAGAMDVAGRHFEAAADHFMKGGSIGMWFKAGYLHNNCLDDPDMLSVPVVFATHNRSKDEAFARGVDALATFERADGAPEPIMTLAHEAAGLATYGHRPEAWRSLIEHFSRLRRTDDRFTLRAAIHRAAHAEAANGRWASAYSLFGLAIEDRMQGTPWFTIDALVWRSAMRFRLGWPDGETELTPLRNALERVERYRTATARHQILFAEALNVRSRDPSAAVALLTRIIEARPKAEERLFLEALFVRARMRRTLGDDAAATADLEDALRSIATMRRYALNYRQAYAETAEAILDELARIREERNDSRRLLAAVRLAIEGPSATSKPAGSDVTVARYVKSGTRLLIVVSHAGQDRIVRVEPGLETIARVAGELATCIEEEASPCDVQARQLGAWLLDPITELERSSAFHVLLPPVLARIPFSILRRGAAARRLIDDTSFAVLDDRPFGMRSGVPSIHEHPVSPAAERIVAIGDPSFDQQAFPALPRIPSARREAEGVIRIHGRGVLLTRDDATPPRVERALSVAHVADIATHAVVREDDPSRSYLLLAPTNSSSGLLYLHEIESFDLCHLELVVLAGCHTAAPVDGEGGASALALAFLAAGAKNVVGSMWEIDDDVATIVSLELHREIAAGTRPAEALRRVQLRMMRSQDERLRSLRAWGGLQIHASAE